MLKVVSSQPPKYGWKQADGVLALWNHDQVVWQWNYAAGLAKPYFHPVALTDGTVLTAPSPADHPWHRALWFSWKMLNGVNYWEENPATGKSDGVTEVRALKAVPHADSSARIEMFDQLSPGGRACRIDGGPLRSTSSAPTPGAPTASTGAAYLRPAGRMSCCRVERPGEDTPGFPSASPKHPLTGP